MAADSPPPATIVTCAFLLVPAAHFCNKLNMYVYHASGTLAATLVGHEVAVNTVAWSPDGT